MNGDGHLDIAAGCKTGSSDKSGKIDVFISQPSHPGRFTKNFTVTSRGKVNTLAAGDINRDGRTDLVAGTKTNTKSGEVELWLNSDGTSLTLADYAAARGPVLCVALGKLDYGNDDVDIAAGNSEKSVQAWFCDGTASPVSGIVPTNESWSDAAAGGVVNAVCITKLECSQDSPGSDVLNDIVIGTAVSDTAGEIVVYLNPYISLLQP
jgi:hypothetical protein